MHKKRSEIFICSRVSEAKFYLYHSTKIANARPPLEMSSEYNSVHMSRPTYMVPTKLFKVPIIFAFFQFEILSSRTVRTEQTYACCPNLTYPQIETAFQFRIKQIFKDGKLLTSNEIWKCKDWCYQNLNIYPLFCYLWR